MNAPITRAPVHKIAKSRKTIEFEKDLMGARYGYLTIIEVLPTEWCAARQKWQSRRVVCRCDCGEYKVVIVNSLRMGKTVSCGCYHGSPGRAQKISAGRKKSVHVKRDAQRRADAAAALKSLERFAEKHARTHAPERRRQSSTLL